MQGMVPNILREFLARPVIFLMSPILAVMLCSLQHSINTILKELSCGQLSGTKPLLQVHNLNTI